MYDRSMIWQGIFFPAISKGHLTFIRKDSKKESRLLLIKKKKGIKIFINL